MCGKDNKNLLPKQLEKYLMRTYPGSLGKNIYKAINTKILSNIAFNQQNTLSEEAYFGQLEKIFNVDEVALKEFGFMVYNICQKKKDEERISELDLQEIMKTATMQKFYHKGEVTDMKRDEQIIKLNENHKDIFLDNFYPDYIKIIQKIKMKKIAQGITDDDIRR